MYRLLISLVLSLASTSLFSQEIGLQLYSLRHEFEKDVPGTFSKIRDMGIREIEMGSTYGLSFGEIIKILAINNLTVLSYGTDFEKLDKFPEMVADEARSYGAKFVVVFWLPHQKDGLTRADADAAAQVLNKAGKILQLNGMMLCYHPHGFEFVEDSQGSVFDYFVHSLDSRYVQLELDVFWVKQAGYDPVKTLRKYGNRVVLLHLKDRKKGTPNSKDGHAPDETNVVLGSGDVDIRAIILEARRLGIKHAFIEDESPQAVLQIPKSLEFLKSIE